LGAELGDLNFWHRKIQTLRRQALGTVPLKRRMWWANYGHPCTSLLEFSLFIFL
jgi:hypothetical protein